MDKKVKALRDKLIKVAEKPKKTYGFECPNCKGYAIGFISENGKVHASCNRCKIIIHE